MSKPKDDWVHQLYIQYAPDLYRIAKYRLQDPEAAYDLTQEVFLTLLDKGEAMKDHPNPGGWLMVTLRHKLGHVFDRRAARAQHEVPDQALAWLAAPDRQARESLDEILPRQLSQRDKELLKMAYEEGLSYQEMSRRLNVPPATCGTWLYRARQRCKHYLTLTEGGIPHEKA